MISEVVYYLLSTAAQREPERITTGAGAEAVGIPEQTASRKLITLEKSGDIGRVGGKILLTSKALSEARRCVKEVLDALDGTGISFSGKVVVGLGEGAYYLSQKGYSAQFSRKIGFKPYPGTLNVSIDDDDIEKRLTLRQQTPIEIPGFKKGNRTFGKIDTYRCVLGGIPCAIVFPERSVHGLKVLEIISAFNLRKKLNLSDDSKVSVEVVPN